MSDPLLGALRKLVSRSLRPLRKIARMVPLHPNLITLIGFVSAMFAGLCLYLKKPLIASFFILTSGLFDILDGFFARALRMRTKFGGTLDAVCDRYGEFMIGAGAAAGGYVSWEVALLAVFSMIFPSYVRARAESTGGMKDCSVGILERPEKIVLMSLASIVLIFNASSLTYAFIAIAILGHITALQRLSALWRSKRNGTNI